nr:COP1-interacting protein 7 [Ipomoea batatas]
MKPSTQLDSVVFHLTPTRTRCHLIIIANGKKEKIASGLLNPFLAHLKTAQDQIAKGGYSIVLEPDPQSVASWFTKGTVERFVRFVSTPDIVERVYIIESEIIQLDEAIAIQGKNDAQDGLVEDHQTKLLGNCDGNKPKTAVNDDKAVVLYKPEEHQPETSSSSPQEGNSRVQILKVLETRKSVLEKEQGMAFARAVAAGFHFDDMPLLLSFGKCFGASRLRDACLRFMELWKIKHGARQWLENGAVEAMASQPDPSGIMFSNISHSNSEKTSDSNEKLTTDGTAGEGPPIDQQVPKSQQEYLQGQFPPWPMHSPASALPLLQPYPVQGVPYCQTYSQNSPLVGVMQRTGPKRQSMDNNNSNNQRLDDAEWDDEDSQHQEQKKKAGWLRNGQSRKIVIQNINYISKPKNSTSNNSESASDTQSDVDPEDLLDSDLHRQNEASQSSKAKGSYPKSWSESNSHDKEGKVVNEAEIDSGHWLAFQNLLFRETNEDNCTEKDHMFEMDKGMRRRQQNLICDDYTTLGGQSSDKLQDSRKNDIHELSINGKRVCSRTANDDFMLAGIENHSGLRNSIDPLAKNGIEKVANKLEKTSSQYMADESFIVPFRSMLLDDAVPENTTTINMDSEIPRTTKNTENNSNGVRRQISYEPSDLGLIPERETEKSSSGYDLTWDYEMQVHLEDASGKKGKKETSSNMKEVPKKLDKDRRAKVTADLDKKKTVGPIRRGKLSKTSPLDDARARADKIRSFKADIQKMKKEKEEEDLRRLETLKLERQKRIAARGSSISANSVAPQSQTRRLPRKLSPTPVRGSKFSDSEPGSSSPLQRSKIRTPLVSPNPKKAPKSSKSSDGRLENNRLTKPASSLFDPNKESSSSVTPDSKASMARIRRLSEPKTINWPVASVKAHSAEPVSKAKIRSSGTVTKPKKSAGPENNKISEIMDLDKRKAATLPELKIRTPKELSDIQPDKSFMNGRKGSLEGEGDENIVEKTVVMLEYESASSPVMSVENFSVYNQQSDTRGTGEKTTVACEHASTDAPPSPFVGFVRDPIPGWHQGQLNSQEVGTSYAEETPKFANIDLSGKPYQPPYAHNSSIEEPCTRNSEYSKAPPAVSDLASAEPTKAHANDAKTVRVYNSRDASAKTQLKEQPRGLRRLWKCGKKNQSLIASDKILESDSKSVNGLQQDDHATSTTSSSEAYTLKNLLSQDETPITGNAVQKSRHFSLLPPFWSRSEKKLTS